MCADPTLCVVKHLRLGISGDTRALLPYSYRRWKLGDDIDLIVRCEHDGVMTGANGEVSFINIKTLNEWDSRVRRTSVPLVRHHVCICCGARGHGLAFGSLLSSPCIP